MTPDRREIKIYDSADAAALAAAVFIHDALERHSLSRRFMLALSGGDTPKMLYRKLCALPQAGVLLSRKAEIFFSDERAVPPESDESNYHSAQVNLVDPLLLPPGLIHRIRGESPDAHDEAARYSRLILEKAGSAPGERPSFDLILLGVGTDGHTASLFPGNFLMDQRDLLVGAAFVPQVKACRFSFSLGLINSAEVVLILVLGNEKAEIARRILSGDSNSSTLPAARIRARLTLWMLDRQAASLLPCE